MLWRFLLYVSYISFPDMKRLRMMEQLNFKSLRWCFSFKLDYRQIIITSKPIPIAYQLIELDLCFLSISLTRGAELTFKLRHFIYRGLSRMFQSSSKEKMHVMFLRKKLSSKTFFNRISVIINDLTGASSFINFDSSCFLVSQKNFLLTFVMRNMICILVLLGQ